MYYTFVFADAQTVDIDPAEIGSDGMGAILDRLVQIHGAVVRIVAVTPGAGKR